jgi:hypothetical protein
MEEIYGIKGITMKRKELSLILFMSLILASTMSNLTLPATELEGFNSRDSWLLQSKIKAVTIDIIQPSNGSTITNGTELLFQLSGSLDKKVFYRWSTEGTNSSFTVQDTYFIIPAPELLHQDMALTLDVYASENSSASESAWIHQTYSFHYDFKAPYYTVSLVNNTITRSFSTVTVTTDETFFSSYYQWEGYGSPILFPENSTSADIPIDMSAGNYTLALMLTDQIGNQNYTELVYTVIFTVATTPANNSDIQTGTIPTVHFSDPVNALYAWDSDSFSGVIDPAPASEGTHILHVNAETAVSEWEIWNFTYTVDNTPIVLGMTPAGGLIPANTNLSITVDETPVLIWGETERPEEPMTPLIINGTDPYWAILPESYGELNVTLYAEDAAGNLATLKHQFNISLGISWIDPVNNTIVDQGQEITFQLNADTWRTILYEMDGAYNTTYLPTIPTNSGLHSLIVYLEDDAKRWTKEYYQWWVKPAISNTEFANGSRRNTQHILNFTFGETIVQVIYRWGTDSPTIDTNVDFILTSLNDWSNTTAVQGTLEVHVEGQDSVWNNQTWIVLRDDSAINITLHGSTLNETVIHTPFQVWVQFNETPVEIRFNWDGTTNTSYFNTSTLYPFTIPKVIATNPHILNVYVRDAAHNWAGATYAFYTGTGIDYIREVEDSRIQGENNLLFNVTYTPTQVGYRWYNTSDGTPLTTLQWLTLGANYSVPIPLINEWAEVTLFYDLTDGVIINETFHYLIDSQRPTITILGTQAPFYQLPIVDNGTTRVLSNTAKLNLTVSEDINRLIVWWNGDTVLINQSTISTDSFIIDLSSLSASLMSGTLRAYVEDNVGWDNTYLWDFTFDINPPEVVSVEPTDRSRVLPNTEVTVHFNETIYAIDIFWTQEDTSLSNETLSGLNDSFRVLQTPSTDGRYTVTLNLYDVSMNKLTVSYVYTVDGTAPTVTLSLITNSSHQSTTQLQVTISEAIQTSSYNQWDEDSPVFFNETTLMINFTLPEGEHVLTIYVEDLLGNNRTIDYYFTIDDTSIGAPQSTLSSGSYYTANRKTIRFTFPERPDSVLASWNGQTNQTLTIYTWLGMRFRINQGAGSYYVDVTLPAEMFETHKLKLYVQDEAGNWAVFQSSYTKTITTTEQIILVGLMVLVGVMIVYWQRNRIMTRIKEYRGVDEVEDTPKEPPKKKRPAGATSVKTKHKPKKRPKRSK